MTGALVEQLEAYCSSLYTDRDYSGRINKIHNPRNPGLSIISTFSDGKQWNPPGIEILFTCKSILSESDSSIPVDAFSQFQEGIVSSEYQLKTVSSCIHKNVLLL
jgi:hypothetical protein